MLPTAAPKVMHPHWRSKSNIRTFTSFVQSGGGKAIKVSIYSLHLSSQAQRESFQFAMLVLTMAKDTLHFGMDLVTDHTYAQTLAQLKAWI